MNLSAAFGQQQAYVPVGARLSSCRHTPTAGRDLRQRSARTLPCQSLRVPPVLASKQDTAEAAAAQDRLTADFGALSDKIEVSSCTLRLCGCCSLHPYETALLLCIKAKAPGTDFVMLWQELAAEVKENLQGTSLYLVGMMGRYVCTSSLSHVFPFHE